MQQLFRLLKIIWVIGKYRLLDHLPRHGMLGLVRLCLFGISWHWHRRQDSPAIRLRLALQELGPIFVKLGQILSTRRDLLTDELANQLNLLQDQVAPFPGEQAVKIIQQSLGKPINEVFADFTLEPLASASVAQVHKARLPDGCQVVVKVIRPNIKKVIRRDINLLFLLAHLLERFWSEGKRLHPVTVIKDYEKIIFDELDLLIEAANTSALRRNFQQSNALYVPQVYWDYCRTDVLVVERIDGIPVADIAQLRSHHVNLPRLAEKGVEVFFTQVFRDSFFHADMHPGNIFVARENPQDPKYIAIDCGIIGTLSNEDKHYLAYNLLAFFQRDYQQVAELHIESGWVPHQTRANEFESAIRVVCEPIFEKPLQDISFAQLLLRLFQTARRFNMEVQPQLVLLQKTLLNIEGLGRQLYPELNLWVTARPYLERWLKQQVGVKRLVKEAKTNLPKWLQQLPKMPELTFYSLKQLSRLEMNYQITEQTLEKIERQLRYSRKRSVGLAILGSVFIVVGLSGLLQPQWWQLIAKPEAVVAILGAALLWLGLRPAKKG